MDVIVKGIRYHVETCGEGFPLVLLHGFTGDSSTWVPFCGQWGTHSQLIIPDIIGHGRTEISNDICRYKIESAAQDLRAILDQLNIEQCDLLGYSMGGRLALTFSMMFPEKVRKLVLESSSPGLQTEAERKQRRTSDTELARFIKMQGVKSFVDYWEDIPLFVSMKRLPSPVQKKIRDQRLSNSSEGLANSLLGMGTGSQPSWWGPPLAGLHCKVLLVTGEEDQKFCSIAGNMMKELKNGKWIVVANSGHAIHVEESEKFGTIISDFVSKS